MNSLVQASFAVRTILSESDDKVEAFWRAAALVDVKVAFACLVQHLCLAVPAQHKRKTPKELMVLVATFLNEHLGSVVEIFDTPKTEKAYIKKLLLRTISKVPVVLHGVAYPSAEHAIQCRKFVSRNGVLIGRVQDTESISEVLRKTDSPYEVRRLGNIPDSEYHKYIRTDWDDVRFVLIEEILRAVYEQHACVREALAATRGAMLIADATRRDPWRDEANLVRLLWMKIRNEQCIEALKVAQQ